jgi:chromosome segregation ATPase
VNRKRTASTGLILLLAIVTATSLVIAGCGDDGSSEEDAQTKACEAVNDIEGQVQQLQSYTLATVTADKVNGNIDAIESDVSEIKSTLPDLSSELKSQLESATDAFTSEISSVAQSLGRSTSLESAQAQITTAADQLANSYRNAFASVSC